MWSLKRFFAQRCWYMVNLLYVVDLLDLIRVTDRDCQKGPGVTNPGDWWDGVQQMPLLTWGPRDRPLWWITVSQRGGVVEVWRAEHKHLGDWKASQTSVYGTWSADFLVNVSWTETPKWHRLQSMGSWALVLTVSDASRWLSLPAAKDKIQLNKCQDTAQLRTRHRGTWGAGALGDAQPSGIGTSCCAECDRASKMMAYMFYTESTE